jgi:hypothetical protein
MMSALKSKLPDSMITNSMLHHISFENVSQMSTPRTKKTGNSCFSDFLLHL